MTNKEAIKLIQGIEEDGRNVNKEHIEALDLAIKALGDEPQGEWIGNAFDEHHCSRCGHPALWEEEPDDYYEVQSRFCPNCGCL